MKGSTDGNGEPFISSYESREHAEQYQRSREVQSNEFTVILCHYIDTLKCDGHPITHVLGMPVDEIEHRISHLMEAINLPVSAEFLKRVKEVEK